jgi:hypothetical protein
MTVRCRPVVLLAALALLAGAHPANAEPGSPLPEPITNTTAEILAGLGHPEMEAGWLSPHLARVGLSGKYGLVYKRALDFGERKMLLRVRGPALGRKKRVGLSFEVRF